jgi:hypothetical protein
MAEITSPRSERKKSEAARRWGAAEKHCRRGPSSARRQHNQATGVAFRNEERKVTRA